MPNQGEARGSMQLIYCRPSACLICSTTLHGALKVVLAPGYAPALSNSFAVLSAGTVSGSFAGFSYSSSNAFTLQPTYNSTSVVVSVTGVTQPPPPVLLSPAFAGSNVLLGWTSVSNFVYRLEYNPNLVPSNWTAISGNVTATSNIASKLDSLTPTTRFYRVRVLP